MTTTGRIRHILCPIDFSDGSRHALDQAAAVARAYDAGVTMLYAFVNRPTMDLPPLPLAESEQERLLGEMRRFADDVAPDLRAALRVREAPSAHEAILDAVEEFHPDLLVMGTHGRSGFRRLFLGSVTEKVIRTAPCPTLVVPPGAAGAVTSAPLRRLLCAVDLSDSSLAALTRALELAHETGASVMVVYVAEMPLAPPDLPPGMDLSAMASRAATEARRRLDELIPAGAPPGGSVETPIVYGRPAREIVRLATERQADLIVMGVHGRGAVDLMVFGSTTHYVLRNAPCPVLVVHTEDGAAALRQYRAHGDRAGARAPLKEGAGG